MTAARRLVPILLFAVLPIAVAIGMFATRELDQLARRATSRTSSTPRRSSCSTGRTPSPAPMRRSSTATTSIWPPVAAFLVSPLTALPASAANWVIALIGVACSLLSLRIVGVRDWRVYGMFALWPPVIGEIRVSHLTPFLCVLLALAWRYRDVRFAPGLAIGLAGAIKFFLWPLGVWLAAIGRARETLVAALVAGASLLLVLPFTSLDDYLRTLVALGKDFDQDSYSPFGFLVQIGVARCPRGS